MEQGGTEGNREERRGEWKGERECNTKRKEKA
jgi:hypothetical protein